MKKIIFFLLFPIIIYSQVPYPKLSIINGDSVCIISVNQVKSINSTYINLKELKEETDSLSAMVVNYSKLTDKNDKLIGSLGKQIVIQDSIITEKDVVINSSNGIIANKENKIRWLKAQRGGLITLSAILLLIVVF